MKKHILTAICALSFGALTFFAGSNTPAKAESVNSYISNNNISHANVTSAVWSGFPKYKYRNGVGKPEGVVVHETGNPNSTIYNEISFMKRNYQNAFVHTFVDSARIINIANTDYLAWGVGYPGNSRFVQFEQVEMHSKDAFAHEVANAAYYTAYILKKYNLPLNDAAYDGNGTVWSHAAVAKFLGGSDHTDPVGYYATSGKKYFGQAYTMSDFYQLVKVVYNNLGSGSSFNSNAKSNVSYDKVTYQSSNQTAKLGSQYSSYRLYEHVKNTRASINKFSWTSVSPYVGEEVYIDMSAKKTNAKQNWYRIRFSSNTNAKRYWVYGTALDFTK